MPPPGAQLTREDGLPRDAVRLLDRSEMGRSVATLCSGRSALDQLPLMPAGPCLALVKYPRGILVRSTRLHRPVLYVPVTTPGHYRDSTFERACTVRILNCTVWSVAGHYGRARDNYTGITGDTHGSRQVGHDPPPLHERR